MKCDYCLKEKFNLVPLKIMIERSDGTNEEKQINICLKDLMETLGKEYKKLAAERGWDF